MLGESCQVRPLAWDVSDKARAPRAPNLGLPQMVFTSGPLGGHDDSEERRAWSRAFASPCFTLLHLTVLACFEAALEDVGPSWRDTRPRD